MIRMKCNCCDGIYNSFDVHFTSLCDNKCAHCIDTHYCGFGINKPDVDAIVKTIVDNSEGMADVLFLGGEPCLFLDDLVKCVSYLKAKTHLKLYVTTSVPEICYNKKDIFYKLISILDGINLSVQHYNEDVADEIRKTKSRYDRQAFYAGLPDKEKIRINLNIVKPYLYLKDDLTACLRHYDSMGFGSIKLSEIQHGEKYFVSFADIYGLHMKTAYSHGCQTYVDMDKIIPGFRTPLLLKRSCFICEDSIKAGVGDGLKALAKLVRPGSNKYGVVYEDGTLTKGWV